MQWQNGVHIHLELFALLAVRRKGRTGPHTLQQPGPQHHIQVHWKARPL